MYYYYYCVTVYCTFRVLGLQVVLVSLCYYRSIFCVLLVYFVNTLFKLSHCCPENADLETGC